LPKFDLAVTVQKSAINVFQFSSRNPHNLLKSFYSGDFMMKNRLPTLLFAALIPSTLLADANDKLSATLHEAEDKARLAMLHAQANQLAEIWSENLIVSTARLGIAGDRDQLLAAVESGVVAYEQYDQDIEKVRIDGDTAIVMGTETAQTDPDKEPVQRRFTHVWVKREGQWRLLARHADLVRG
jgi:hypothetical protein